MGLTAVASRWTQAATILPPTLKVCGRRLLPFCLRHRVALEAIESPVILPGLSLTPDHILAASKILSSHDLGELRKPATWRDNYHYTRLMFNKAALAEETAKIRYYFDAQSLWPRFWNKDSAAAESGTPWPLAVIASLIRNGSSYEQAWTMPESEAIWLHIAHSQANGSEINIVTEKEWEAMEAHREQMEATNNPRNSQN